MWLKITLCLDRCLASKRSNASCYYCKNLNPYIKWKLIELGIKVDQEF